MRPISHISSIYKLRIIMVPSATLLRPSLTPYTKPVHSFRRSALARARTARQGRRAKTPMSSRHLGPIPLHMLLIHNIHLPRPSHRYSAVPNCHPLLPFSQTVQPRPRPPPSRTRCAPALYHLSAYLLRRRIHSLQICHSLRLEAVPKALPFRPN